MKLIHAGYAAMGGDADAYYASQYGGGMFGGYGGGGYGGGGYGNVARFGKRARLADPRTFLLVGHTIMCLIMGYSGAKYALLVSQVKSAVKIDEPSHPDNASVSRDSSQNT